MKKQNKYFDIYIEDQKLIASMTGFNANYIDVEIVKSYFPINHNEYDYFKFNYQNKSYILDRGVLTEISDNKC